MNALFITLTTLVIIAAVLITIVVLLQNGKGDGLASNFVAGNQTFGVRQTADILEKITWGLCVVILVLSICTSFFAGGSRANGGSDLNDLIEANEAAGETLDFEQAEGQVEESTEAAAE